MKPFTSEFTNNSENEFVCPLCQSPLAQQQGQILDVTDGVSLWCPNSQCPAQEVSGHGKNAKEAFSVIVQKYRPSSIIRAWHSNGFEVK